jgi:hypothetical protein
MVVGPFSHCCNRLQRTTRGYSLLGIRLLREDLMRCARKTVWVVSLLLFVCFSLAPPSLSGQVKQPYVDRVSASLPPPSPLAAAAFDGAHNLVARGAAKEIRLVDGSTFKVVATLPLEQSPSAITFSSDGAYLFVVSFDGKVSRWNLQTRLVDRGFTIRSTGVLTLKSTAQGQLISSSTDGVLRLIDPVSSGELASSRLETGLSSYDIAPATESLLAATPEGNLRLYSLPALTVVRSAQASLPVWTVRLSSDGTIAALVLKDGRLQLWDVKTLGVIGPPGEKVGAARTLAFDPKDRWLAVAADSLIALYDLKSRTLVKTLREGQLQFGALAFVGDEHLWALTAKGDIAVWRVLPEPPDREPPVVTMAQPPVIAGGVAKVFARSIQIEVVVEDKSALKSVIVEGVVPPIEMKEMGGAAATGTAKRYTAAVPLSKEGMNSLVVHAQDEYGNDRQAPLDILRLSDQDAIEVMSPLNNAETDSIATVVKFRAWFAVDSYRVVVNMQDMAEGSGIRKKAGDLFVEGIPLVAGYNQIQLVVTGTKGEKISKSFGVTRKVIGAIAAGPNGLTPKARDTKAGPEKWAVVVGTSEYMNRGVSPLKYADKDAEAFAKFLQTPEGGGYESDHIRVLLNKDATLANLHEALIDFLQQAIDKDLALIYFAGHGLPDPARPQNLYLLTYDTDPTRLGTTAFPMWQIKDVLERHISAKRIIVFSDACHSGGISVDFATRGMDVTKSNLINQYLADLSRTKEGIVIFTASAAGEVSQEITELGHGVFTYCLLEGMKGEADFNNDYTVTINELMQYVEDQVKRRTKGAQNPMRSQTVYDKDLTISQIAH